MPNYYKQHMAVCGLSLYQGSMESRKTLEQKNIFQIGTVNPHSIKERVGGKEGKRGWGGGVGCKLQLSVTFWVICHWQLLLQIK